MAVNLFKQDYDNSLIDASVNGNYFSTYHNIVTYRQKEEQGLFPLQRYNSINPQGRQSFQGGFFASFKIDQRWHRFK